MKPSAALQPPRLHARCGDRDDAAEQFCRRWWQPLHACLCHRGVAPWDAADLTQGFFEKLIRTGKLEWLITVPGPQGYLHTGVLRYWHSHARDSSRLRRGGGAATVSLDDMMPQERSAIEPVDGDTPEEIVHRRWASEIVEEAERCQRARWAGLGRLAKYEAMRSALVDEAGANPRAVAEQLQVSEVTLRVRLHRLKREQADMIATLLHSPISSPVRDAGGGGSANCSQHEGCPAHERSVRPAACR